MHWGWKRLDILLEFNYQLIYACFNFVNNFFNEIPCNFDIIENLIIRV